MCGAESETTPQEERNEAILEDIIYG